jgi:hypothetical protein
LEVTSVEKRLANCILETSGCHQGAEKKESGKRKERYVSSNRNRTHAFQSGGSQNVITK